MARLQVASRLDRRPARAARRWRSRPQAPTRQVSRPGQAALRTGLILATAVFAVLVLFPLVLALAGMPYR